MSGFVVTISAIALLLAGIYVVFWTPGAIDNQPASTGSGQLEEDN